MSSPLFRFCPWDGYTFQPDEMNCVRCGGPRFQRSSSVSSRSSSAAPPPVPWKKILYETQVFYEDNHVDDSFLASLVTNANVTSYDYWTMTDRTTVVTQEISTLAIFFIIFAHTLWGDISETALTAIDAILLLAGYLLRILVEPAPPSALEIVSSLKSGCILIFTLLSLSPVLQTLTRTYSNDTIYSLTITLSILHVFLFDYTYIVKPKTTFSESAFTGAISLNAAMFAAVLLASRLPSIMHVFAFMFFSIQIYAFWPLVRRSIRNCSRRLHLCVTVLMVLATWVLLSLLSTILAIVYFLSIAFITFICPMWLIWIQKYKNEIQGPWDIPIVRNYQS
eukprot:GILI01025711.1.p1 GENE.GILI01025711.1~~GILI01025711.1.p1  ORF type:complete len:337 (+),score=56.60 GILI01025711.1:168-1178(+)